MKDISVVYYYLKCKNTNPIAAMKKKKGSLENQAGHDSLEVLPSGQDPTSPAVNPAAIKNGANGAVEKMLQRFSVSELAILAKELPDIFSGEQLTKIAARLNRRAASPGESAEQYIDEQIKTIAAYIRERENSFNQLPVLPREALRQLIMIRKYASTEEVMQLQDRIMNNLQKQFGPFDESGLVMFLVKYLL